MVAADHIRSHDRNLRPPLRRDLSLQLCPSRQPKTELQIQVRLGSGARPKAPTLKDQPPIQLPLWPVSRNPVKEARNLKNVSDLSKQMTMPKTVHHSPHLATRSRRSGGDPKKHQSAPR